MNSVSAALLWGVATLLFLLLEALTPQLLSVWFSVGALAALIVASLSGGFFLQIVVFLLVSGAMCLAMRPLSRKFKEKSDQRLNLNRVIGRHAIVVQTIDSDRATGQVRVDGALWSAKSADGTVIEAGLRVKIVGIEGVRAVVRLSRVQPQEESGKAPAETGGTSGEAEE